MKPAVPYHIQYGGQHSDPPLGNFGGKLLNRIRGVHEVVAESGRAIYTDNGLLSLPRAARLQEALYVLKGLFDRVELRENVKNMARMVCQPCRTAVR